MAHRGGVPGPRRAASIIPGPSSTEVAIYIGYRRGGLRGLALAGSCFILPAALLVSGIAWAYVAFGRLPTAVGILRGVEPVVVAVIAQALWTFGRTALKSRLLVRYRINSTWLIAGGALLGIALSAR